MTSEQYPSTKVIARSMPIKLLCERTGTRESVPAARGNIGRILATRRTCRTLLLHIAADDANSGEGGIGGSGSPESTMLSMALALSLARQYDASAAPSKAAHGSPPCAGHAAGESADIDKLAVEAAYAHPKPLHTPADR